MAELGEMLVRVGAVCVMVKVRGAGGVCPAEATDTEALPAVAIKVAGTVAVSCPAFTKVVVRGVPFQVMEAALV